MSRSARKTARGGLGSPYSIADYRAVNPAYGMAADVKAFVTAAHGLGMRVILDWVGNHTAFDHPWVGAHRDWYTLRPDGSISFPRDNEGKETDWTDVADLNFDKADMRLAMIADMKWWLDEMEPGSPRRNYRRLSFADSHAAIRRCTWRAQT